MYKLWLLLLSLLLAGCANATRTTSVGLHGTSFSVELATNAPSREHGLMMRTSLAQGHGMLFAFPHIGPQGFWMKNTLIPLDILYFNADRRLVSMQQNVPPCKVDPCPIYPSAAPALYVLEVSAGTAARIGIELGDELKIGGDVGDVE
ncbi:MAG: DUF192 domain-containing protein [Rhodanobacter sp.]